MPKAALRIFVLAAVVASLGVISGAQSAPAQPKQAVLGISLDSNYARIADYLPNLRDTLVKQLPKRRKQLKAMGIDAAPGDAVQAAQSKGCDYLLQMSVTEERGVGVGFSSFGRSGDISPEEERQRQELAWVFVHYRLRSLKHADLDEAGVDQVRYADLPIGWDPSSFETTVFRTVTRVAVSTLNKLPKK